MTHDLLFELGCEELPAKQLRQLEHSLGECMAKELSEHTLTYKRIDTFATPRRLAVLVHGLDERQAPQKIERRGPSVEAAFDASGTPTLACLGFARSCGVTTDELSVTETSKGNWLYFEGEAEGKATAEILPEIITKAMQGIVMNRSMRWGNQSHRFLRPVQWACVRFGDHTIHMPLFDIESGDASFGHRFHQPGPILIKEPASYASTLQAQGMVVTSWEKRRDAIAGALHAAAKSIGQVVLDEELLDEVASLVEWPVILRGQFSENYLAMPRDVLITSMQSHQKCFAIEKADGSLVPYFLLVSNIESNKPATVIKGNERVIDARLSDAHFFYNNDIKTPLKDRAPDLAGIVFTPKLGSMADKSDRLSQIAAALSKAFDANKKAVQRAAMLSKCDLTTDMVGEFPSLQGVMGYHYALAQDENPEIANAIKDAYLPKSANDDLPADPISVCLALADRLDSLVGIIGTQGKPKGDKDPFALRRQALAIVRVLLDQNNSPDMKVLLKPTLKAHSDNTLTDDAYELVWSFVLDRFKAWALDHDFTPQQFEAVAATGCQNIGDFYARLCALREFTANPHSEALASANKRVMNILKKQKGPMTHSVQKKVLTEAAEIDLMNVIDSLKASVETAVKNKAYTEAFTLLATLKEPVDTFFDDVMIMADDATVRKNRLAILSTLKGLLTSVAEISEL